MAFKFPFTNYHELNLTWVLEQLKKLFEESAENVETIESYENRLSAVETELPVVADNAQQAVNTANAAATLAQTAKATADHAEESAAESSMSINFMLGRIVQVEYDQEEVKQQFTALEATVQDFDGRITQAEDDASETLQEAQSFNNRVNAAINTANNAANTATIAQGIAVNANQNAATALDTAQAAESTAQAAEDTAQAAEDKADANADHIGDLSELTTEAKSDLVSAINEVAANGGAVDSVNGKTGDVVLNAGDIGIIPGLVYSNGTTGKAVNTLAATLAPVESSGTASRSYAVGDLLVYNYQLYKVVSQIAAGGSLTPGTNIVPDTIEDELSGIKTDVADMQSELNIKTVNPFEKFFNQYMSKKGSSTTISQELNNVSGTFSSSASVPYQLVLSNTFSTRSGTIGDFTPTADQIIPIESIGGNTAMEITGYMSNNTPDGTLPNVSLYFIPVLKEGDTITRLSGNIVFPFARNGLNASIKSFGEGATTATHLAILLYFSRRTKDFSFDCTYEFRPVPETT